MINKKLTKKEDKPLSEYDFEEKALPPADDDVISEDYEETDEKTEEDKASEDYYELPKAESSRNMIWSVLATVLGILSIPASGIYVLGLVLSCLAIGSALLSRYRLGYFDKLSVYGLIFGIMGAVCGIFALIVTEIGIFDHV